MKTFNRFILMLAVVVAATQTAIADAPSYYYNNATGKSDEALMTALRNIIYNHTQVSYSSGLLKAFAKADTDAQGYIIDIYSTCHYSTSDNGSSASTVGQGYNREHSFPRSWFGGEVDPMNTDVFHIYPTDIFVNSKRGNHPYGVCAGGTTWSNGNDKAKGRLGTCTYPGYSGTVFEPDDEYKGDLARSYFYMVTCYKNELPSWPGSPQLNYSANKYKAFSTWTINMLMEWTRQDPVSEKEIKRNEAIYGIQGNRNPFIDHPELAEYIWGNMQGQSWPGPGGEIIPAELTTPVNGSTIDLGSTPEGTPIELAITVKGKGLTHDLTLSMIENEYFYVSRNTFTASEVNSGTTFTIGFSADEVGAFSDIVTLSSDEVSTTFTITATATKSGDNPPPVVEGDSIVEDWEGCTTGGYWTKQVQGHTWMWDFTDAGIWGDNLKHGELSCRLGKTNASAIAMAEDVESSTRAIAFWAGCFGNDADATLRVDYSTDSGLSWTELGSFSVTRGALQHITTEAPTAGHARFRIVQTSGSRVNIDDFTIHFDHAIQPLYGDVNGDGEVNIADVNTLIAAILSGNSQPGYDVNTDSEVNLADVNIVIDLILGSN